MEASTLPRLSRASTYLLPLLGHALRPKELRQTRMFSAPIGVQHQSSLAERKELQL